ncbi:MAG: hypothetical protein EXQ55_10445 [Acidobacteria bacterium]|nr:hypothetical protein [Acidobacteriota bacterium]
MSHLPLPIADGLDLDAPVRSLLMPGLPVRDSHARIRRLPRFFYVVDSWDTAFQTRLTPHFAIWEFMDVDLYEPAPLRRFPRYVPCAVTTLAAHLEVLRAHVGASVHIAANGGYRSPSHGKSTPGSPHAWGGAANIYRIGDEYLDGRDKIERYSALATGLLPALRARPYGPGPGCVDDHVHLDLGYVTAVPADAPGEEP